ncbi:thioredoxin domain-containing protein [endosymbiont of unidentified scaly snail isolate Monju]|uniref:thioredoxin domain-containing protein n=1 Tax=endosymbiont of unidentified scaly snail isolate Monju TaxID=1248727 RepID=UPI0003892194|nr:thioredoxin domain-containing protein [endosymbiont of unidentified scaly snail isolate Monju]BAN70021.1 conserved hypothetical protein [endosymbiont of unidentified scaly snail isolate Monju]
MSQNRLTDATSPYLQQHADNPVHWWPWCEEALSEARSTDRPILLSIGYSACHWCHVMAHESFEDPATAELMNRLFINIKVDREERPDLDRIYQNAHQLLAQRPGGWPLTVFLDPHDLTPFFAGTYFPPESRHGLPSFSQVLESIDRAWREQREAIGEQNHAMRAALTRLETTTAGERPGRETIEQVLHELARHFDPTHGGIGQAPKFPHPATFSFLLHQGAHHGHGEARHMALFTLERMAEGGLFDQLGGGFYRYSVDERWEIPHFEKMLYDNGPLLALYAEAWALDDRRPLFRHVCERTAEWVLREMQSPEGGFWSSLDADSEGEEGRFYLWDREEVASLLDEPTHDLFAARFGLDGPANFEGRWHLRVTTATDALAERFGLPPRAVRHHLKSARETLFAAREQRVHPGRDEKVLTSWNALMIHGMARAGRLLDRPEWIDSAARALDFLYQHHWKDGRLLATSRDGEARLPAYLDDHAYLIDAILELLQARWSDTHLGFAVELAERLLTHFADTDQGGFYFTADDHETLPVRPRPFSDDALPSGNAIAARALLLLGWLLAEPRYLEAAEGVFPAADSLRHTPHTATGLLDALDLALDPPTIHIARGSTESLDAWQPESLVPGDLVYRIPDDAQLSPALATKRAEPGRLLVYRCTGTRCETPFEPEA